MAFTLTQYEAVQAAIASGELVVQYDGKKIEYRSMDDLLKAKAVIETDLVARGYVLVPGAVQRGGTTYATFSPD